MIVRAAIPMGFSSTYEATKQKDTLNVLEI